MKNLKKNIALLSAMALAGTMLAGCNTTTEEGNDTSAADNGTTAAPADNGGNTADTQAVEQVDGGDGKVLKIYCWNEEFKSRFEGYYKNLPADVTVDWVITPNEGNAYQDKLDQDLLAQGTADEPIDLFLFEADYALKYVNSDFSLDVKSIGITDADTSAMYQYTKDICTDSNGALKGVSWQATPGLYAYRRAVAKEVLGTDDPAEVQSKLSNWDDFNKVAADMKAAGYYMLSGYDDSYRTFSNNVSAPWVDANKKIVVDDNLMKWVDQTKEYTDNGYNEKTGLWSAEWTAGQGPAGKVFGYFYSTWGINFTLAENAGENGVWAVCPGPQAYYWGGSWLAAAKGTDNAALVRDVMYELTCNKDVLVNITKDTQDYTNNEAAMNELAKDFSSEFLGGQNHIALFAEAAPKIDMSKISAYDQGLNESFQAAFKDYFDGNVDKDTALANFYTAATEKYPGLTY